MPRISPVMSWSNVRDQHSTDGPSEPPSAARGTTLQTVGDLVRLYNDLHLPTLKDPGPVACRIRNYFVPLLSLPLHELTVPTILSWMKTIREHSTTQADGCLTILRSMINKAIEWQVWPGQLNPAAFVKRKRQAPRTRYLVEEELPQLIQQLESEPVAIRLYFYLCLFCAPRPGEVERMKREHVTVRPDGTAVWFKPTTKTTEHRVPLPFCIPELIRHHVAVLAPQTPWLFPGRKGHHLSKEYWHARWADIRARCGLEDVQLRDLRRTCSTRLLNDADMPMDLLSLSKGVLNHSNLNTTQVYARPMLERIGTILDAHMRKTLKNSGAVYRQ